MTKKRSKDILHPNDNTLEIDLEKHDIATSTRGDKVYVLVLEKGTDKIVATIPAVEFEFFADFYYKQVYGSYIEKDVTWH